MTTFLTLGLLSGKFNRENPIHRIKSYLGSGSIITDADPRIRIRNTEIFSGNYHWKITRPGQTSATVCVHPRNFSLENLPQKFSGKSPISVDIFTGFPRERFLGISTDLPQNCYLNAWGGQIL